MFERFTDRARRVLVLAQEEARLLNHSYIGTEHILLGLIHEDEGLAARALGSLNISLEAVREKVKETIGPAGSAPTGSPPFTPRAKKVLELSLREALQLGHNYIGTEHILLGLVREGDGVAAQVLQSLGADLPRVRQEVIQQLSGYAGRDVEGPQQTGPWRGPMEPTGRFAGVTWPRYPNRVLAGPEERLNSDGVEFRITGALLFDVGCQLFWRLAGIPSPIVDLLNDPNSVWPQAPVDGPPLGAIRGDSGAGRPSRFTGPGGPRFLELSDSSETPYRILRTTFEPQATTDWAGSTLFAPGVPGDATSLLVSWRGESLAFDLSS